MIKTVTERNGFIYLKGFNVSYPWCEGNYDSNGCYVNYFPLNKVTRESFKKDILPLIKSGEVTISNDLYNQIRLFSQNPARSFSLQITNTPAGITLKDHQLTALKYMSTFNKFGFFLGMGTGKTLIAITYLMNARPDTCLIVTPQKVIGQYQKELDKYIPGSGYVVTNYEQLHKFVGSNFDTVILDESHRAKSFSSNINVNCRAISEKAKNVFLFTGTPQDKSRHEILAQLAILDSRVMKVKTKIHDRYFEINDYFQPAREKINRSQELTDVIGCYTWGKKAEDVITLTNENNFVIKCPHPDSRYDELFKHRIITKPGFTCSGDNKGVLRVALRELCCGIINWTDYEYQTSLEVFESTKVKELDKLVAANRAAIVYYEFTASLPEIKSVLESNGRSYVVVNGTCNSKSSAKLIEEFKSGSADYLVIQSRSGNAGLDLTNVNTVIFYSLPESYIVYSQAKARIRRIGQSLECNYYHLICESTVEEAIYNTLKRKKSFSDKVFLQYIKGDRANETKRNSNQ